MITSFIYSLHAGVKVLFLMCVDCICFTLCANHFHRLQRLHLYRYCYLFVVYLFHSLQQLMCCIKRNLLVCACLFTYGAVWKLAVGFIIDGCDTFMKFACVQVCMCVLERERESKELHCYNYLFLTECCMSLLFYPKGLKFLPKELIILM